MAYFSFSTYEYFNFRNGSGSSAGTTNSRDASPTYQNWSNPTHNSVKDGESKKTASDCTSSTECSEDSDRNSDNNSDKKPTPAPRTTVLDKNVVDRLVKQVRHESLV